MKKILFLFSVLFFTNCVSAQIVNPVKWSFKVDQKNSKEATLVFTVKLDEGWHIYSQKEFTDGPLPTIFNFSRINGYSLVGSVSEPGNGHIDKMWEEQGVANVIHWEGTVVFKQKIKILTNKKLTINGNVSYMVCKESCIPLDTDFSFTLNANASETVFNDVVIKDSALSVLVDTNSSEKRKGITPVSFRFISKKYNKNDYELVIQSLVDTGWVMSSKTDAKNPLKFEFILPSSVKKDGDLLYADATGKNKIWSKGYVLQNDFHQRFINESGDSTIMKEIKIKISFAASDGKSIYKSISNNHETIDMSVAVLEVDPKIAESYWLIFLVSFLSGFIALVMPCIFPMIPMTVSFFLKRSKTRRKGITNAMFYGASIVFIYVTLGVIISAAFGSDALNALATNIWFNLFFFLMLIVFAFSFLGGFEITLPNKWVNAADKGADKGGFIGIFFMAFTLALVSFSCTGPIVGDLLVIASKQGGWGPFWGMLGFSLAIALPFTLFAIFPSILNSMPQSGGWLNTVKVSLGFLELAFSFKFLSNADLVIQAHLLERETFIAIWIGVFAIWGLYLLGKFKLSHDSDLTHLSVGRVTTAIFVLSFTIYLVPGLWGAPLKWISGFPPPSNYSESPYGIHGKAPQGKKGKKLPQHAAYGPHQLVVFEDYDYALAYSKEINKPLLIDFTGYACVNCRKMEETVWSEDDVLPIMRDSVVLVSLFVDSKISLPDNEHYVSKFDGKNITTVGQKWSDLQKSKYKSNAQPQYFMLDNYETVLNGSANFQDHGEEAKFSKWLNEGVKRYTLFNGSTIIRPDLVLAN